MNIRNVTSNSTNQNVGFLIFTCVKIRKVIYLPEKLRAPIANILVSFIALVLVIKLTCLISGEVFSNLVPRLLFGCWLVAPAHFSPHMKFFLPHSKDVRVPNPTKLPKLQLNFRWPNRTKSYFRGSCFENLLNVDHPLRTSLDSKLTLNYARRSLIRKYQ